MSEEKIVWTSPDGIKVVQNGICTGAADDACYKVWQDRDLYGNLLPDRYVVVDPLDPSHCSLFKGTKRQCDEWAKTMSFARSSMVASEYWAQEFNGE